METVRHIKGYPSRLYVRLPEWYSDQIPHIQDVTLPISWYVLEYESDKLGQPATLEQRPHIRINPIRPTPLLLLRKNLISEGTTNGGAIRI